MQASHTIAQTYSKCINDRAAEQFRHEEAHVGELNGTPVVS
jgi:hypothetical protein